MFTQCMISLSRLKKLGCGSFVEQGQVLQSEHMIYSLTLIPGQGFVDPTCCYLSFRKTYCCVPQISQLIMQNMVCLVASHYLSHNAWLVQIKYFVQWCYLYCLCRWGRSAHKQIIQRRLQAETRALRSNPLSLAPSHPKLLDKWTLGWFEVHF